MRHRHSARALLFLFCCLSFTAAARAHNASLATSAASAVSENAAERDAAIAQLRAAGPAGLDALFETHAGEIARQLSSAPGDAAKSDAWLRLSSALDRVSRQRDSFASRLYWHTDIEEAKRAARAAGKPILSLRLLGDLGEEYSCANSRFFRTALYANPEVSRFLREHFVLHWKTVRPAPRITIDFGDGRRIETTVTGNSIHYILDAEGWPVDALPGLYGPAAFLREIGRAEAAASASMRLAGERQTQFLTNYYNARALELIDGVRNDARRAGVQMPAEAVVESRVPVGTTPASLVRDRAPATPPSPPAAPITPVAVTISPSALRAAPLAMTKRAVEGRTVRAFVYDPAAFAAATGMEEWAKLAALHRAEARLDARSVALITRHNPHYGSGPEATATAARLARVVSNFEARMALDTVRNEYLLRPRLLQWFIEGASRVPLEQLNERVYADLFLTPDSDPWLGLLAPDTYSAIRNDGVRHTR